MKTSKFLSFALLFAATGCVFNSCSVSDNEKLAEEVEDVIASNTEYYIVGKVFDEYGKALGGVNVATGEVSAETAADGMFTLTVKAKGNYKLEVEKSEYMADPVNVSVAQSAANRSSVFITLSMTKLSESFPVEADESTIVTEKGIVTSVGNAEVASVEFPANALSQDTKVSVTPYLPVYTSESGAATSSTVLGGVLVRAENSGATLNKPMTIRLNNNGARGAMFDEVSVLRSTLSRAADDYETLGAATLDWENGTYAYEIAAGRKVTGAYGFSVKAHKGKSSNVSEVMKEATIDNTASPEAMNNVEMTYTAKGGWEYLVTPKEALRNIPDGARLEDMLGQAVEALEGAEGTFDVTKTEVTNLSGYASLTYKVTSNARETEYSFKIKMKGGPNEQVTVKVKRYTDTRFEYAIRKEGHSGGVGGNL